MQSNVVISPVAASSSIEITEIYLGSALFAYNNVFIALLRGRDTIYFFEKKLNFKFFINVKL